MVTFGAGDGPGLPGDGCSPGGTASPALIARQSGRRAGRLLNGSWSKYEQGVTIRARGGCHNGGWWWKTGQNVRISTFPTRWNPDTDRWTSRGYWLPADARNGSTRTAWV